MPLRFSAVLLLRIASWGAQGGSPECPCLDASPALAEAVAVELKAEGLTETYGLLGCRAYDLDRSYSIDGNVVDCVGASREDPDKRYCFAPWCYVDQSVCRVSREDCPNVGSSSNPFCRERPKTKSLLIQGQEVYYSYETCGALNTYAVSKSFPEMDGRVMRVAPMVTPPTSFQDDSGAWTGSLVELLRHALKRFNGTTIEIANPIVSQESVNQINGSYWTSCVHDVGIGRLDACIGDFWVTQERLQLATYLPSFYDQPQYFLISLEEKPSIGEILWKPFAPLELESWIMIIGFLVVAGLALYFVERTDNDGDFPPEKSVSTNVCFSLYYGIGSLVNGMTAAPQTTGGKCISLALGFFALIATSTYTATLASLLVTNSLSGSVGSFNEAIEANYRICTDLGMGSRLLRLYPELGAKGILLMDGKQNRCPGMVHRGEAEGMIFSPPAIERMYSGYYVEADCAEGSEYLGSKETCPQGEDGGLDVTRDCKLRRIGDAPLYISVSMPVATHLQHALGWAFTSELESGTLAKLQDQFKSESYAAKSICPALTEVDETEAVPASALIGSLLISGMCVLGGLILGVASKISKRSAAGKNSTEGN